MRSPFAPDGGVGGGSLVVEEGGPLTTRAAPSRGLVLRIRPRPHVHCGARRLQRRRWEEVVESVLHLRAAPRGGREQQRF